MFIRGFMHPQTCPKRYSGGALELVRGAVVTVGAILLAACATGTYRWHTARTGKYVAPQGSSLTSAQERSVKDLCAGAAMPAHRADYDAGPTEFVVRPGYALEFSNDLKVPLWVCEHVTAAALGGTLDRSDPFKPDLALKGPRSELEDYKGSGYDRGHQAPAGDQTVDRVLKSDTFFLSNMAPQVPAFNQQVWAALESQARDWAREFGEVWIITGEMLYDPAEEDATTADGWIKYKVIGPDGVAVPTHFYKIVAKRVAGQWDTIGFVLENRKYAKPYDFSTFITSIRTIEDRTGIIFLPESIDETQKKAKPAMWH